MRAILLAAGFGTRLKPITDVTPKCLVPIKGIPLLEIWLESLRRAGINKFLINTHYLSDQVDAYVKRSLLGDLITTKFEPVLLGTAGTLINNIDFFEGKEGMLLHADNLCRADLTAFQAAHNNRPKECLLTMMTFRTNNPSECGIVEIDERGVVTAFYEKSTELHGDLANGAIYILSAEFINILNNGYLHAKDFSKDIISEFVGEIYTYETKEIFLDIGTPKNYLLANEF